MLNEFSILYLNVLNQFSRMDKLLIQSRLLAVLIDVLIKCDLTKYLR